MRQLTKLALAALLVPLAAAPLAAQQNDGNKDTTTAQPAKGDKKGADKKAETKKSTLPPIQVDRFRPNDQRGINVFETPKESQLPFDGFKVQFGAAFTQQFQGLQHSNSAAPKVVSGVDQNALIAMGHGFNNAVANAYLSAQLTKGVRVSMTSYLSARHHNETWVKDGYLLIDESPIDNPLLNDVMKYVTIKAGHFEVNYGDQHFRRTDNGNALYNPFVGNLVLDAFVPQVGGEVYLRAGSFMAMGGVTNGEEKGMVLNAAKRGPAYLAKLGYDSQINKDLRVRLTASTYQQDRSSNEVLYSGDRAGSRYYDVLENTASSESTNAWSGMLQPFSGPSAGLHAVVVNPFVKFGGLEYFGTLEQATGKGASEASFRTIKQTANDLVYRFAGDQLYVAGRYNTVSGQLAGIANDISVDRYQLGAGWFITPTVLTKVEWVNQNYNKFPTTDIRSGGNFKGFVVEGTVTF